MRLVSGSLTPNDVFFQDNPLNIKVLRGYFVPEVNDNLQYFYNNKGTEASDFAPKNRLRKVTESSLTIKGFKRQGAGGDYTYDANGNLKTDPNKGITLIEYNHLN